MSAVCKYCSLSSGPKMPKLRKGKKVTGERGPTKESPYISQSEFFVAVAKGDVKTVREIIDRGTADINKKYNDVAAILHALKDGHYEVAVTLIDAGCNLKVSHKVSQQDNNSK